MQFEETVQNERTLKRTDILKGNFNKSLTEHAKHRVTGDWKNPPSPPVTLESAARPLHNKDSQPVTLESALPRPSFPPVTLRGAGPAAPTPGRTFLLGKPPLGEILEPAHLLWGMNLNLKSLEMRFANLFLEQGSPSK